MYFELGLVSVITVAAISAWSTVSARPGSPTQPLRGQALVFAAGALSVLGLIGRASDTDGLEVLGAIGLGTGITVLAVAPAIRAVARWAATSERYELAMWLLARAELLAPGTSGGDDRSMLLAMRDLREGRVDPTIDALTAARQKAPAPAQLAIDERIAMLYLAAHRWDEGIAYANQHLWPAIAARARTDDAAESDDGELRRVLGVGPAVWVELIAAYGRVGDLERAAAMVGQLERACVGQRDSAMWLHRSRMVFLALAGRPAAVARLTTPHNARHLSPAVRAYWCGLAAERHGDPAAAALAYAKARARSRGRWRALIEQASAALDESSRAPVVLGPTATDVVAAIEHASPPVVARLSRSRRPIATVGATAGIIAVAVVVSLAFGPTTDLAVLLRAGAIAHTQIAAGEWWRVISGVFVHVGLSHLLLDALSLWIVGRLVERMFGTARMFAIFALAGFGGAIASYALSPDPMSAGVSGAVSGLLAALLVELGLFRAHYRAIASRQLWFRIALVAACNFAAGLFYPAIDQWAHVGGFVSGGVVAALLSPHARWARPARHLARALAIASLAVIAFAAVQVARTSTFDSLTADRTVRPLAGVTVSAPAEWDASDSELADPDIFLVLVVAPPTPGGNAALEQTLAATIADEPDAAVFRHFDQATLATEQLLSLPSGWRGSELELSFETATGDDLHYRAIVCAKQLGGEFVIATVYAPESLVRDAPEAIAELLASIAPAPPAAAPAPRS